MCQLHIWQNRVISSRFLSFSPWQTSRWRHLYTEHRLFSFFFSLTISFSFSIPFGTHEMLQFTSFICDCDSGSRTLFCTSIRIWIYCLIVCSNSVRNAGKSVHKWTCAEPSIKHRFDDLMKPRGASTSTWFNIYIGILRCKTLKTTNLSAHQRIFFCNDSNHFNLFKDKNEANHRSSLIWICYCSNWFRMKSETKCETHFFSVKIRY